MPSLFDIISFEQKYLNFNEEHIETDKISRIISQLIVGREKYC